jgi:putative ABC transport system permease protein
MFWNNVKIALRNLRKNKAFALVNILGLALGLTIYVFGGLLEKYENTHDMFFENSANIYTIGSIAAPDLNVGVDKFNSTFTTIGPIIEAELQDVEKTARIVNSEFLLSVGRESFYETIGFADAAILEIFDFSYIHGDASALQDPTGLLLNETTAIKYFGRTDVLGETMTFDNEFDVRQRIRLSRCGSHRGCAVELAFQLVDSHRLGSELPGASGRAQSDARLGPRWQLG